MFSLLIAAIVLVCSIATTNQGSIMTVRVFNDVPMPDVSRGSRNRAYPFDTIEVGQSFFVEGKTPRTFGQTIRNTQKRLGKTFVYQSHDLVEDGKTVSGVMVWRKE